MVSNNTQNEFDENIVVVGLTTDEMEKIRTFEVYIKNTKETGLEEESKICCDYLHTVKRTFNKVLTEFEKTLYKKLRLVDKKRLGTVSPETMIKVKRALKIVLNLEKEV